MDEWNLNCGLNLEWHRSAYSFYEDGCFLKDNTLVKERGKRSEPKK